MWDWTQTGFSACVDRRSETAVGTFIETRFIGAIEKK